MHFVRTRRLFAAILIVALHSYSFALPAVGMLYVNGPVQVDGVEVKSDVAVTEGQSINVSSGGTANLRMGSTSVIASQNTVMTVHNSGALSLKAGNIFVNSITQVSTDFGACGSVTPMGNNGQAPPNTATKYEIQMRGNTAYVYARELSLALRAEGGIIHMAPQTVAVVQNVGSAKCTVAYYPTSNTFPTYGKAILVGSWVAAPVVPLAFFKLSAEKP